MDTGRVLHLSSDFPTCLDEVPPVRQLLRYTCLDPAWFFPFARPVLQPVIEALWLHLIALRSTPVLQLEFVGSNPGVWRARTVPSGMSILRAISRSPTPAAYPVLTCSQMSFVIFRRILVDRLFGGRHLIGCVLASGIVFMGTCTGGFFGGVIQCLSAAHSDYDRKAIRVVCDADFEHEDRG